MKPLNVVVAHDADGGLWFVESSDIPGLNAEAASYEALVEVVMDAAPDLIAVNLGDAHSGRDIPVCVQQRASVRLAAVG